MSGLCHPPSFSVRLLPAADIALARHALAAAASAAPVLPPQGHLISPWREYGDVASNEDEELGHIPATLILRTMRPKSLRALSFQNLAEREAQHRHWRCEYEKPGQRIQVFQVQFEFGEGEGARWRSEYVGCRRCLGSWPCPLVCPDHQFALNEYQLKLLWKNWVPAMDPINPVEHEDDDGWDLPGSFAYYVHFGVIV